MISVRCKRRDTAFALAFEEYLLSLDRDDDIFVLWQGGPAVVCGRFQNIFRETDVPLAAERSVGVFRRISGGGAVYHDGGNVNYTVISRRDDGADTVRFTAPVAEALGRLGVGAETDGSDITVKGVKISGSARANTADRTLHHGTLLFDVDLCALAEFTSDVKNGAFSGGGIKSRRTTPQNVAPLLPGMTADEFCDRLAFFATGTGDRLTEDDFDAAAVEEGAKKYRSPGWTFGDNPKFSFSASLEEYGVTASYESRGGTVTAIDSNDDGIASLTGVSLAPGEIRAALRRAGKPEEGAARIERFLLTGR